MNLQIRNINYKTFISAYVKEPVLSYELTNKEYQQTKQRGNGEIWAVLSYELTNKEYQRRFNECSGFRNHVLSYELTNKEYQLINSN